jgi:aminoglycoside adenylyltransferase-like protein/nucleotidyltransferase-like protein
MINVSPYPQVNKVLDLVLSGSKQILQDQFVAMYLYGSLASGDYDPRRSDIDFVVVTRDVLPEEAVSKLEAMHARMRLTDLGSTEKLEGSYVPISLIRRHDPTAPPCPSINEGEFFQDRLGSDWIIQRYVIREFPVVLSGPDPKNLIDPISPDEIRKAVLGILHEWWFPMLEDSSWLRDHGSSYHGFAVITMCRALHALQHGCIVSKPAAIAWAKKELGDEWQGLIEQAVASQYGEHADSLNGTLEFIRFTNDQISRQMKRL